MLAGTATRPGVSAWGHCVILAAKGSTTGIGLIFLPFPVLFAVPGDYGLGRRIAANIIIHQPRPAGAVMRRLANSRR